MNKVMAMVLAVVIVVVLSVSAFAATPMSLDQAKQVALNYVGVSAAEAVFTKTTQSFVDGHTVCEIAFFAGNTEYDMNIDASSGIVTGFYMDYICR